MLGRITQFPVRGLKHAFLMLLIVFIVIRRITQFPVRGLKQ